MSLIAASRRGAPEAVDYVVPLETLVPVVEALEAFQDRMDELGRRCAELQEAHERRLRAAGQGE
jgi:hypothetical protein